MTLWFVGVVALLLCAAPAVADAPLPASKYDTGGQLHNDFCATPIGSTLDLRYLSGVATGFYLPNTLTFTSGPCVMGQIRLDLHEKLSSQEGPLVFHRGGTGYADADNVRYGQVRVSDLESVPDSAVVPSGDNRGAACPVLDTPYKVSVQPIPQPMKYKSLKETYPKPNTGASYLHYGDPAAQQGVPYPNQRYSRDPSTPIHYSTLTWSWVDVDGGGENRILLQDGQDIRLCNVKPIRRLSWDHNGEVNGWVIARYVQTQVDGRDAVYGWMVWQHYYDLDDKGVVDHFREVPAPVS